MPVTAFPGVDIGTSSTNTVAFDPFGTTLAAASIGCPLHEPMPGRAEQDPDQILAAVHATIQAVLAGLDVPGPPPTRCAPWRS